MDPETQQFETPVPSTMHEVESLVLELYRPGPPRKIAKIQETLQRLQRSADGWKLAISLLESNDEKVRFFGALTFTVKLNSDSDSLSPSDAKSLLGQLIGCLIHSLDNMVGPLVAKKLCSTLVVYFLRFSSLWPMCVKHLIHSLCIGGVAPIEWLEEATEINVFLKNLSMERASAALWFSMTLAEEVGKTDANHMKHHKFHDRLILNVDEVVALIRVCLIDTIPNDPIKIKLRKDAMKCYQSWVLYSHRVFVDTGMVLEPLKSLTKAAISCLTQPEMYEVTVELFSDILSNYSGFLEADDFHLLFALFNSQWSRDLYERLLKGDFEFDSLQYGQFMIAFGDAIVQDLARKDDPASRQFLTALGGLLNAGGFAVAEDRIFVPALEFWSTFVEVLIDSLYSEEGEVLDVGADDTVDRKPVNSDQPTEGPQRAEQPWFSISKSHVLQAIEYSWQKIQFPPPKIFASWDSTDRIGFADARKDVADLLQSSYTIIGASLFSQFATMTIQALHRSSWRELEASLFCLGSLADCVDQGTCDTALASLFGSPLFSLLSDEHIDTMVRTSQAALSLIGQFHGYFERHTDHLPNALTFLFEALKTKSLSSTASRSIQSLSFSCRQALTDELDVFLYKYEDFISQQKSDGLVQERLLGAIAAIIQALPTEDRKTKPLTQLIRFMEADYERCLGLVAIDNLEVAETVGIDALRGLASVAKGLQAPSDIPVNLESQRPSDELTQYWIMGEGAIVQGSIRNIVEGLPARLPGSGDIIEAACNILRAGFAERHPNPFVFPTTFAVEFLLKANRSTPRIGTVISTACSLVSSGKVGPPGQADKLTRKLLDWVLGLLQELEESANDPEIAQAGIDFVYRLLPVYLNTFLNEPPAFLEFFFLFTLQALKGRDPLPKSASIDFWSHFVATTALPHELQRTVNDIMEQVGPAFANALIFNISGNAARSELDRVSEPLKKLVTRQIRSKQWLENALSNENFHVEKIEEEARKIFLQKIITLRGAKQTNQVVKDFWLACRGSNFAYAS